MKREAKILFNKAKDSLILAIEIFNRPHDSGRQTASLIFLDHAFEMLLKAAILHKNGRIRNHRTDKNTIGFDECLRKAFSNQSVKFLSEEQVIALQAINGERDAAQHHILYISEQQLYIFMQSGLTLFEDIMLRVFGEHLRTHLPRRVLPIATLAPLDIEALFRFEILEIKKLLAPKSRKKSEALARIRPLAILNSAINGDHNTQLSESELNKYAQAINGGKSWNEIFPGVSAIQLEQNGTGPNISLRISKKAEAAFQVLPPGSDTNAVIALKRVNELEFYNLSFTTLKDNLTKKYPSINQPKLKAVLKHFRVCENPDFYKEFKRNSIIIKGYSPKALQYLLGKLDGIDLEQEWRGWR